MERSMQAGLGEAQEEYLRIYNLREDGESWEQIGKRFHTTGAGAQSRYAEDEKEWNRGMKLDTLKTGPIEHETLPFLASGEEEIQRIKKGHDVRKSHHALSANEQFEQAQEIDHTFDGYDPEDV